MPDVKKAVYLILAAMMAYYNSTGEECPVKDTDIINEATPEEFGAAIASVINLWKAFYKVPNQRAETSKKDGQEGKKLTTAHSIYQLLVGEIGIPRRDFLYEIDFWEVDRIIAGL